MYGRSRATLDDAPMEALRAENAALREEVKALTILATARGMKATDLGKLAESLNATVDRLEAKVKTLKINRWAGHLGADLWDWIEALRAGNVGCDAVQDLIGQMERELAHREGKDG